jgi:hypothetical protein
VLVLDGGQNITLDVQDVREYQVLGEMIGQKIVRIEIDRHKVPSGLGTPGTAYPGVAGNTALPAVPFALFTSHHAPPGAVAGIIKAWDFTSPQTDTNVLFDSYGLEGIRNKPPAQDY